MKPFWERDQEPIPRIVIGDVEVEKGSRVRLHPKPGGDIMDIALAGRVAYVEAIEQDFEDRIQIAVIVEDDPGRDLGELRQPGHRFFFSMEEVEPLNMEEVEPVNMNEIEPLNGSDAAP